MHKWSCGLTLVVCLVSLLSCSDDRSEVESVQNQVHWKDPSAVSAAEGIATILISGVPGVRWTAQIAQGATWCSFALNSATPSQSGILHEGLNLLYVYYRANADVVLRQAQIDFTFADAAPVRLTLNQLFAGQNHEPHFASWAELPVRRQGYDYVTHYAALPRGRARNYSICFDALQRAALWVAYPLHDLYLGSVSRTDAWAFDPMIPRAVQPDVVKRSYTGNYDRGHQLPSADRLASYELNAQTFYMTNMTPQLNRLNQDMWANLEAKVRSYICSDTLYVVTGCWFGAGSGATTDGAGNNCPIPSHYFKVLLRTVGGKIGKPIAVCSDGELMSIGFWVEQRSYGQTIPLSICTSVAEIEAKTGFSFFPQCSAAVKQQNRPGQWGIN